MKKYGVKLKISRVHKHHYKTNLFQVINLIYSHKWIIHEEANVFWKQLLSNLKLDVYSLAFLCPGVIVVFVFVYSISYSQAL